MQYGSILEKSDSPEQLGENIVKFVNKNWSGVTRRVKSGAIVLGFSTTDDDGSLEDDI